MNDADACADAMISPREKPRITRWRNLAANYEHRFGLIILRRIEIVFRADAESPRALVNTGLLHQRRLVSARIDHQFRALRPLSAREIAEMQSTHIAILDDRRGGLHAELDLRASINRTAGEELIDAFDIHHAGYRGLVVPRRFVVRREEAAAVDRVQKFFRDAEIFQLLYEAAAGCSQRRSDFLILLDKLYGASGARGSFGGSKSSRTPARDQNINIHC